MEGGCVIACYCFRENSARRFPAILDVGVTLARDTHGISTTHIHDITSLINCTLNYVGISSLPLPPVCFCAFLSLSLPFSLLSLSFLSPFSLLSLSFLSPFSLFLSLCYHVLDYSLLFNLPLLVSAYLGDGIAQRFPYFQLWIAFNPLQSVIALILFAR